MVTKAQEDEMVLRAGYSRIEFEIILTTLSSRFNKPLLIRHHLDLNFSKTMNSLRQTIHLNRQFCYLGNVGLK